ncbi:hypothetical protein L9F63_008842, partial [Diploptera punctata]
FRESILSYKAAAIGVYCTLTLSYYILLSNFFNYELYFRIVFLTFSVCEGALGLSILAFRLPG